MENNDNNSNIRIEYKEKQVILRKEKMPLDFNKISFAFGFSYSF
jgi:hypothetical protein